MTIDHVQGHHDDSPAGRTDLAADVRPQSPAWSAAHDPLSRAGWPPIAVRDPAITDGFAVLTDIAAAPGRKPAGDVIEESR